MTWTEREGSKEAMHGQWRKKQYLSACIKERSKTFLSSSGNIRV